MSPFIISEIPFVSRGQQAQAADALKDPEALLFFPICWQPCLIGNRQFFDVETGKFGVEDMLTVQNMYRESAKLFVLSPRKLEYL